MSTVFDRNSQRWLLVKNNDTLPAPPYALLAPTGIDTAGNITVTRPVRDGQAGLLINGPLTIPPTLQGQAHQSFPAIVAYDDPTGSSEPANGDVWGAKKDQWKLQKGPLGPGGFLILGGADNNLVNALPIAAVGGVNLQTGTSYTFLQSDYGQLVSFSNAAAIAATLPQASLVNNFFSRWFTDVENRGAGTLTITPTTSTIDGASSLALTQNQGCRIFSDGTNYYTMRGAGSGGGSSGTTYAQNLASSSFTLAVNTTFQTVSTLPTLNLAAGTWKVEAMVTGGITGSGGGQQLMAALKYVNGTQGTIVSQGCIVAESSVSALYQGNTAYILDVQTLTSTTTLSLGVFLNNSTGVSSANIQGTTLVSPPGVYMGTRYNAVKYA